jgi:arsenate reductase (glutaredoxin)
MPAYPILINRPFVITSCEARLRQPSEVVFDILVQLHRGFFAKKHGEVAGLDGGRRAV